MSGKVSIEGSRAVTDDEVARYHRDGWVKLDRFIDPSLAAEMLDVGRDLLRRDEKARSATVDDHQLSWWRDRQYIVTRDRAEPFVALSQHVELGRSTQRLMGRSSLTDDPVPVRLLVDTIICKAPKGSAGSSPTSWHQDFPAQGWDRGGALVIWIALDDVTTSRGAMQFLTGSHREGSLGQNLADQNDPRGLLAEYPNLAKKYETSGPVQLRAGDATVHNCYTVHGALGNISDVSRWSYTLFMFPGDVRYFGPGGILSEGDVAVGDMVSDPRFPQLFP